MLLVRFFHPHGRRAETGRAVADSFEAVFSPLGPDGEPRKMWDRDTGALTPTLPRWQAYDIRLQVEARWQKLQPLWAGRVHIIVGDQDTFYLNGAVHKLAESLSHLGSDAEVTFLAGRGHSDLLTPELYHRSASK